MLFKNIYGYSILGFEKDDFIKVFEKIIESNLFLAIIHPDRENYTVNTEYESYLTYKNAYYTQNNINTSPESIFRTVLFPEHLSESYYDIIKEKIKLDDDFTMNTTIQHIDSKSYVKFHKVKLYEQELMDCSIEMNEIYEKVDRDYLDNNFVFNKQIRVMLLPPKIKDKGSYLTNYVMLTIYEEGFITLNTCVQECVNKQFMLYDEVPRSYSFEEVSFYDFLEKEGIESYLNVITANNINLDGIINYYKSLILNKININFFEMQDFNFLSWGIADFTPFKKPYDTYNDFKNRYKEQIIQLLTNCEGGLLEKFLEGGEKTIFDDSNVLNTGSVEYFCRNIFSVFTLRSERVLNSIESSLEEYKKEKTYQEMLRQRLSLQVFFAGAECVRFFELAYIKIYFLKYVIKSLDYNEDYSVESYNDILFKINKIKFQYSSEVLFNGEGSPKKLYEEILEKTGSNSLEEQTQTFLRGFKDEVDARNIQKKNTNDTLLLILSSVLTIILSFSGLNNLFKIIFGDTESVLIYTLMIWIPLFIGIVILNIRRWLLK